MDIHGEIVAILSDRFGNIRSSESASHIMFGTMSEEAAIFCATIVRKHLDDLGLKCRVVLAGCDVYVFQEGFRR